MPDNEISHKSETPNVERNSYPTFAASCVKVSSSRKKIQKNLIFWKIIQKVKVSRKVAEAVVT